MLDTVYVNYMYLDIVCDICCLQATTPCLIHRMFYCLASLVMMSCSVNGNLLNIASPSATM